MGGDGVKAGHGPREPNSVINIRPRASSLQLSSCRVVWPRWERGATVNPCRPGHGVLGATRVPLRCRRASVCPHPACSVGEPIAGSPRAPPATEGRVWRGGGAVAPGCCSLHPLGAREQGGDPDRARGVGEPVPSCDEKVLKDKLSSHSLPPLPADDGSGRARWGKAGSREGARGRVCSILARPDGSAGAHGHRDRHGSAEGATEEGRGMDVPPRR